MYAGIANSGANSARKFIRNATRTRQTWKKIRTLTHKQKHRYILYGHIEWSESLRPTIHANTHMVNEKDQKASWQSTKTYALYVTYEARGNNKTVLFYDLRVREVQTLVCAHSHNKNKRIVVDEKKRRRRSMQLCYIYIK